MIGERDLRPQAARTGSASGGRMAVSGTPLGQEDHFMDRGDGRLPNA